MTIFPDIQMFHADLSAEHPFVEREFGWTRVEPHRPRPGDVCDIRVGVIEACTATNREIEERIACGEFSGDVINEYTTWLWFCDRESFRWAWCLARLICNRSAKLRGVPAGEECGVKDIDGWATPGLGILASGHHVGETA